MCPKVADAPLVVNLDKLMNAIMNAQNYGQMNF